MRACERELEQNSRRLEPMTMRLSAEKSRAIVDDEFRESDKISMRLNPTADNDDLTTPYPNHQEFLDRSNIRT